MCGIQSSLAALLTLLCPLKQLLDLGRRLLQPFACPRHLLLQALEVENLMRHAMLPTTEIALIFFKRERKREQEREREREGHRGRDVFPDLLPGDCLVGGHELKGRQGDPRRAVWQDLRCQRGAKRW